MPSDTELSTEGRLMLQILALDPTAVLKFSEWTQQWYIEARIEQSDGTILGGIVEHRPVACAAVAAFHEALRSIDSDHVLVVNAYRDNRRHWRWNGAAFALVPDNLLPWKLGRANA